MLRRQPDAILIAHRMDRHRRELYVEGLSDKLLLQWVVGDRINLNVNIIEIAFVDLPDEVAGGERGRLFYFADVLGNDPAQIRMFADADWDRLLERSVPARVWLTDLRDMEGYVLCEACINKVLRLGIKTEKISAAKLLAMLCSVGRQLGLLRLMSEIDGLNLPFQKTSLKGHVDVKGAHLSLKFESYLRALLQNAQISLSRFNEIQARLEEIRAKFSSIVDEQLIHGKDAMTLLDHALAPFEVRPEEGGRIAWTALEAAQVAKFSEFGKVLEYLSGAPLSNGA
jgi:hypothetical protein